MTPPAEPGLRAYEKLQHALAIVLEDYYHERGHDYDHDAAQLSMLLISQCPSLLAAAPAGLREALERLVHAIEATDWDHGAGGGEIAGALIQARVAELSAAAPQPALDVDALRIIAGISENRVTVAQADALGWLDGWLAEYERLGGEGAAPAGRLGGEG